MSDGSSLISLGLGLGWVLGGVGVAKRLEPNWNPSL